MADRKEFDTGDDIVVLLGDENSVDLLLPDRVVFFVQLGHIAMISLECFV